MKNAIAVAIALAIRAVSPAARVLAAVFLTTVAIASFSSADPVKVWFLTLDVWTHTNASLAPSDKLTIRAAKPFNTRDECLAKLRTIKKNPGLAYDIKGEPAYGHESIEGAGYGIARVTGRCRSGSTPRSSGSASE